MVRKPRKKKVEVPQPIESESTTPVVPLPVVSVPPYPLPINYPVPPTTVKGDDLMDIRDIKKLWKTKTFWAALCLFLLSITSIIFGLPQFAQNPIVIGIGGMIIAVLWVVLRMATNNPVTPSINFPHPNEWLKMRQGQQPPG